MEQINSLQAITSAIIPKKVKDTIKDLLIFSDCLESSPEKNFSSIFGDRKDFNFDAPNSEFNLFKFEHWLDWQAALQLGNYIYDAGVPKISLKKQQVIKIPSNEAVEEFSKTSSEAWFFINGVATNKTIAEWNGKRIYDLFGRPLTVLHNPTDTLPVDLVECVFDRTWNWDTAPAHFAVKRLRDALKQKEKVIVITHSQGGIIMQAALEHLKEDYSDCEEHFHKLEIYTFACPADEMVSMRDHFNNFKWPFIEHFANEKDLICKLGILRANNHGRTFTTGWWGRAIKNTFKDVSWLFHKDDFFKIDIRGNLFLREGKKGHLLNAHYLDEFLSKPYKQMQIEGKKPRQARLYSYLNGKEPRQFKAPARKRVDKCLPEVLTSQH